MERIAGRWEVVEELGRGAQGRVLAVRDPEGRTLAAKTVAGDAADPALLAVLQAELARMRQASHPGLLEPVELVVDRGRPWLLTRLVRGPALLEAAGRAGPPGSEPRTRRVLELAGHVLGALEHLHAAGLVHLDVKPAHLLVGEAGPVLIDLGLAARAGEVARRGTPGYAAPEVLLGHPVDRRADLWSLGATLHHALTGVAPAALAPPDPERAPAPARRFLAALLEPDRTRRPGSAGQALALLGVAPLGAPAPSLPPLEGPLLDRDEPLARLLAPLLGTGADPALVVTGPPGSGRSRLLREAASRAMARGARVFQLSARSAEGGGPFGALAPLLSRLGLVALGGGDPEAARARLLVEAGRRTAKAAAEGPLVLAVDDLEAATEEALELLGAIAAALRLRAEQGGAALWLATAEGADGGAGLARLLADLGGEPIRLEPRTPEEPSPAPLPAPGSAARRALEALALLGRPCEGSVCSRLVLEPAALDGAARSGAVRREADGRLGLASPALRARLLGELGQVERRALARELLLALEEACAASPAELAGLALASEDPLLAGPRVLAAAREGMAHGALASAGRWLSALLTLDGGRAAEARSLLGEVELARGEREHALERWRGVLEDERADPALRGQAGARAARQLLNLYRDAEALAMAGRAEALLGRLPAPAARCDLAFVRELAAAYADPAGHRPDPEILPRLRAAGAEPGALAGLSTALAIVLYRANRLDEARALLEGAIREARAAGDRRAEGSALLNLGICLHRLGQPGPAAERTAEARRAFDQAGDVRGVALADLEGGLSLLRASRYRPSAELLGAALTTFRVLGDRARVAELLMNRGAARLRLGDPGSARVDLLAALAELQEPGLRLFCLGDLALLAAERGDEGEAMARLGAMVSEAARADAHFALQARIQRATTLLRLGLPEAALAEARSAHQEALRAGAKDLLPAAATVRAEAALSLGSADEALEAAREAIRAGAPSDRARPEAVQARALVRLQDHEGARAAAARALEAAGAGEDALDRIAARMAQGEALLAGGDAPGAARALGPALMAARAAGLRRRAEEAEALLERALRAVPALEALERLESAAERPAADPEGGLLGKVVAGGPDAGHMLDLALGLLVEATGAERGLLVLLDQDGHPGDTAARNIRDEEMRGPQFGYSRALVEEAATRREPVLVKDALADPRFSEAESVASLAIRSVLTVPVMGAGEGRDPAVLAVLYLDDRTQPGRFGEEARDLARRMTAELAPAFRLARERAALERDAAGLRSRVEEAALAEAEAEIVGASEPVRVLRRAIGRAARTDLPVLVEGESGTGKELIARAIHSASRRATGPFVAESCAAVSDDLLESELFGHVKGAFTGAEHTRRGIFATASGGTLFLDEVSSMSPPMQSKLLRVLQEGQVRPVGAESTERVDVRVIAASNERLEECVAAGRFRQDLFYRLAVITIPAPPLRERREDVPLLVAHFARKHAGDDAPPVVSDAAMRALAAHAWPGNVRELENAVRRLIAFQVQRVLVRHLPPEVQACAKDARPGQEDAAPVEEVPLEASLERVERRLIERAMRRAKGNVSQAARALGMERTKLIRRMRALGIEHGRRRP